MARVANSNLSLLILLSTILFLAGCTSLKIGRLVNSSYISSAVSNDEVIPFQMAAHLIVIPVVLEESRDTLHFAVNTGSISVISDEVAHRYDLSPINEINYLEVDGKNDQLTTLYQANRLRIGKLQLSNVAFTGSNLQALQSLSEIHIDGIIGNNVLNRGMWKIDYLRKELTWIAQLPTLDAEWKAFPFRQDQGKGGAPMVRAKLNDEIFASVEINTGNPNTLVVPHSVWKRAAQGLPDNMNLPVRGRNGGDLFYSYQDRSISKLPLLTMGEDVFCDLPTLVINEKRYQTIQLGKAFLEHYVMILDYQNRSLYLKQQYNYPIEPNPLTFGLEVGHIDGKCLVSAVIKGSVAYQYGLVEGDEVLKINDWQVAPQKIDTVRSLFEDKAVDSLSLVVKKTKLGRLMDMQLHKKRLWR